MTEQSLKAEIRAFIARNPEKVNPRQDGLCVNLDPDGNRCLISAFLSEVHGIDIASREVNPIGFGGIGLIMGDAKDRPATNPFSWLAPFANLLEKVQAKADHADDRGDPIPWKNVII